MCPCLTSIGGSCPSNIGSSPVEEASGLEGCNDRFAERKGVRLDLCLVITIRVGVWVTADFGQLFSRCMGGGPCCDCCHEGKDQGREDESRSQADSPAIARNNCHSLCCPFIN